MIEILHEYKKDWSMFTLASLLDKSRDFRLHLYVHEDDWADAPIDWVIANFDEVKFIKVGGEQKIQQKCFATIKIGIRIKFLVQTKES